MCSSWVRGEAHAQFQGEGAVAIRLPYPTAVLAFDEGYQSEGLQLLAWHIEASNARSGSGSRDISQEDSRENSSLSKCHCSGTTDDIDTYYLPDFTAVAKAAAIVAERESLEDSWLNSAAAGFTYFFTKQPEKKLWREFPGLRVYTASLEYIFATKIMAGRSKDEVDIMALAKKLNITSREDVIALLAQYVPEEAITSDLLLEIGRRFKS